MYTNCIVFHQLYDWHSNVYMKNSFHFKRTIKLLYLESLCGAWHGTESNWETAWPANRAPQTHHVHNLKTSHYKQWNTQISKHAERGKTWLTELCAHMRACVRVCECLCVHGHVCVWIMPYSISWEIYVYVYIRPMFWATLSHHSDALINA